MILFPITRAPEIGGRLTHLIIIHVWIMDLQRGLVFQRNKGLRDNNAPQGNK